MPNWSVYPPPDPQSPPWGVQIVAAGAGRVRPGDPYPLPGHPADHQLSWERGRILGEWQLILIARGRGRLRTRRGEFPVRSGQLFMVVPRIWHAYRPDPDTGWDERWLALGGRVCVHLTEEGVLAPERIVTLDAASRTGLDGALDLLSRRPDGYADEAVALIGQLLARLRSSHRRDPGATDPLRHAAEELLLAPAHACDIARLARAAGLSGSQFRRRFLAMTGRSPRDYHRRSLLARAQRLLADHDRPMATVASMLGFADAAYFSRWFARHGRMTASAWRDEAGGSRWDGADCAPEHHE